MARPRQGEGIKRTIRKRGDKLYAYEITSVMENGKKKTVSKYLGRVDPVTNKLLEKIPEKSKESRQKISEQRSIKVLKDICVADFGGTYFLDSIQRRLGLGEDLNKSFGSISTSMLSIAFALVQSNGVFDSVEGTLKRTWTKELYSLDGVLDSGTLSRMTQNIGISAQANMEQYFEYRVKRNKGIVAWDTTTMGCHSDMDGMAEYIVNNKDNEDLKQVKASLATDPRGVPIMYRLYPGNVSDMDTVKNLASDIDRFGGGDVIFVMDRGFCSGWNLRFMIQNKHRFVVPAVTSSKAIKKLLTGFNQSGEAKDMEHDRHMYRVWKTEIGITEAEGRTKADGDQAYSFTVPGDEGHTSEGKLTAYVCYDSKKYSDEVQNYKKMIHDLTEFAETIDAKDPVKVFKKKAGNAIRHFNVEPVGRKVKVVQKPKSVSFEENRAGLFVMLTSEGIDWNTLMTAYDARRLTEQGYDRWKGKDRRFRTSDKNTMKGREFLNFLDMTIRCEIAAELRDAGETSDMTVEGIISSLDCIQVREYHGTHYITEIDKRQRDMFKVFDIPIPKEARSGEPIF